jgi:hypothetical protein
MIIKTKAWFQRCCTKKVLLSILFGQLMSLFVSATGLSAGLLTTDYQVALPTTQSLLVYVVLTSFIIPALFKPGGDLSRWSVWQLSLWTYLPIAVVDVEANFFVFMAFQYTGQSHVCAKVTSPKMLAVCFCLIAGRFRASCCFRTIFFI